MLVLKNVNPVDDGHWTVASAQKPKAYVPPDPQPEDRPEFRVSGKDPVLFWRTQ